MYKVHYFSIAVLLTEIGVVLQIINFNDNPDYKITWLIIVLIVPVAGFMIYSYKFVPMSAMAVIPVVLKISFIIVIAI